MRAPAWLLSALLATSGIAGATAALSPGGVLTRPAENRNAFALPAPTLDARQLRDFNFGNRLFNTNWVVPPASVAAFDGLGPTFNRVSCSGCHVRDGRGRPPVDGEQELLSMLVRASVPGTGAHGGPRPHPAYGEQINDRAVPGVPREARVAIAYDEVEGRFDDGTTYRLRAPRYALHDAAFGPADALLLSPRVATHMLGMGLLEAVPESAVLARADPDDSDGDGISGRPNRVFDPTLGRVELGRFGWKANAASLLQQIAGAANGDIGLTSRWFPQDNCPDAQTACAAAAAAGIDPAGPELSDLQLEKLLFYMRTIAVPQRRAPQDPAVRRGARQFEALGCAACHTPRLRTADAAGLPLLAGQDFAPYTDLLLHDMGEGLADQRPDFLADGREWRTAPLWGLGLVPTVNGHSFYLHDGRARSLEEAVLWHGGEAAAAQRAYRALPASDRAALLAFLADL